MFLGEKVGPAKAGYEKVQGKWPGSLGRRAGLLQKEDRERQYGWRCSGGPAKVLSGGVITPRVSRSRETGMRFK